MTQWRSNRVTLVTSIVMMAAGIAIGSWMTLPVAAGPATARADGGTDAVIKALLQERHATRAELAALIRKRYESGQTSFTELYTANQAEREASLDLCETDEQRAKVLRKMVEEAKGFEKRVAGAVKSGEMTPDAPLHAKAERLDLEIALARLQTQ